MCNWPSNISYTIAVSSHFKVWPIKSEKRRALQATVSNLPQLVEKSNIWPWRAVLEHWINEIKCLAFNAKVINADRVSKLKMSPINDVIIVSSSSQFKGDQ